MRRNRILALSAALALACAVTTPANAQFGNILNKAKKAVEGKVEQKVEQTRNAAQEKAEKKTEEASDKSLEKVGDKTGLPVPKAEDSQGDNGETNLYTLYKKDYKPSAAAIAAFPDCQGDEVYKGCSRTVSQRYGAYEHLDPKYFPLQPYYKYPLMYGVGIAKAGMGVTMLSNLIRMRFANGYKTLNIIPPLVYDEKEYPELLTPQGEKMGVYADEVFRCSSAALFFADPNSEISVRRLAMLLAYLGTHVQSGLSCEKADDDFNGILDAKQGLVLPAPKFKNLRFDRERIMIDMACRVVDFDLIVNRVIENFEKVIENDAFCQKDSDPKARRATMLYTRFNQTPESLEILRSVRAGNVPAVSMPKGVSVPADLITKSGGKTVLTHCTLQKSADGQKYVMVVGSDSEKHPVK